MPVGAKPCAVAVIEDMKNPMMLATLRKILPSRPGAWVLAVLAAVLIVQGVRLIYALAASPAPLGAWAPRGASAIPADQQAALFARVDPFYRTQTASEAGPAAVTALQLQLFGIRINEGAGTGSAIIAGSDGVQKSIGVGEEIQPGVTLSGVRFDHVEISNAGKVELLYLDQSQAPGAGAGGTGGGAGGSVGGAASVPAPNIAPPAPSAAVNLPISPASLRAGISFAPRGEGARITGIRVGQQGDGTAFAAAGFRAGDVIRSVNGRTIASAADVAALNSQIAPGARLSLEIERGATTVPLAIIIPTGNTPTGNP